MNKKIKTVLMLFVLIALFSTLCTLKVNAARIVFEDNDNPDYVTVLSLNNELYTINVDDESKIGYVVKNINGSIVELGTCKVTIVDYDNSDEYIFCYSANESSLGELTITISGGVSTVTYISGEINNIIELYTIVELIE